MPSSTSVRRLVAVEAPPALLGELVRAIASAAFLDPPLLVTLVRSSTVAKLLSIGFVVRRCRQCSAGKS
jgi:hypothetical protein